MAKFTEVFSDETKLGHKIPTSEYLASGKFPIIDQGQWQIAGYTDLESGAFTDVPAIIFGDHTRIVKYVDTPFFLGADGVKVLKAKVPDVDYKYLFYCLQNAKIPNTGYNRHFKWLKELEIPLPPLEEQRHIAAVLDKVTDLIAQRRAQLDKLDLLVKSRFVEMFGDPVDNSRGWDTIKLKDIGTCKNGMNFHTDDFGVKIHCLGVADFKDNSFIDGTSQLAVISLNEMPTEEYLLKNRDIVFVRSNGNKSLVGRSVMVYPGATPTTFSGFCIRFRLQSESLRPIYLLRVLKTDSVRKKLAGRGANIQNLNQKILLELSVPIPPLELQDSFENFEKRIVQLRAPVRQSLNRLEILKISVMQQYFG